MPWSCLRGFGIAVEDGAMIHQSVGRNQKSCFMVKHVIQITSALVIVIWFFYQIKNSNYNTIGQKFKDGSLDFGRRGNLGANAVIVFDFYDGNPIIERSKNEDGEDSEGNGSIEEKKLQTDSLKLALDNGTIENDKVEHQGKDLPDSAEDTPTQLTEDEATKTDENENENENENAYKLKAAEHSEEVEEKDNESDLKGLDINVDHNMDVPNADKDEESKDNAEDKIVPSVQAESATVNITGIDGFQDENGIPPSHLEYKNAATDKRGSLGVAEGEGTFVESNNSSEVGAKAAVEPESDDSTKANSYDFEKHIFEYSDDSSKVSMLRSSKISSQEDTNVDASVEEEFKSENTEKYDNSRTNGTAEKTQEENMFPENSGPQSENETQVDE